MYYRSVVCSCGNDKHSEDAFCWECNELDKIQEQRIAAENKPKGFISLGEMWKYKLEKINEKF